MPVGIHDKTFTFNKVKKIGRNDFRNANIVSLNIIIIIFNFESFVTANKFNETENTNYFFMAEQFWL